MRRIFLLCVTLLGVTVWGQNSGIQGVVTDPSGASVPDAAITLTNTATGVVNTARTNERGFYSVPFLSPAFYKVEPALAAPHGESFSTRSAQVNRRCTFIKRALVRTLGGAKHARIVCLSLPETRPQADRKVSKVGCAW